MAYMNGHNFFAESAHNMENNGPLLKNASGINGFSSSLPIALQCKGSSAGKYVDIGASHLSIEAAEEEAHEPLDEEMVLLAIGDLLPDDEEELLPGIADGFDFMSLNTTTEENEDIDIFSSGGGLEMDGETQGGLRKNMNKSRGMDGILGNTFHGPGSVIGDHPYGEHPSRTLFVRNINSSVEDSELRALFEPYGDIRTLYTACKHRGFVMISYFDIRAARTAMRALQNKPLRRRKLDIHFSIPKDNPSDKDINQGTLVIFNLDASVSNDHLRQIFGKYGEVKEIRETPHRSHHKFIEFYDVRAAELALRGLNRSDIGGKRIKLEPSRPGGPQRSLIQHLTEELEQEETCGSYEPQSSSPVISFSRGPWGQLESSSESGPPGYLHHSPGSLAHNVNMPLSGLSFPMHSTSLQAGTIGSHLRRNSQINAKPMPAYRAHSLPEYSNGIMPFCSLPPPAPQPIRIAAASCGLPDGVEGLRLPRTTSVGIPSNESLGRVNSVLGGGVSLSGPPGFWGNSGIYQQDSSPGIWSTSPIGLGFNPMGHEESQPFGYGGTPNRFVNSVLLSHGHHAGSPPSVKPPFLERKFGYFQDSPDTPFYGPGSLGAGVPVRSAAAMLNMNAAYSLVNFGSLGTKDGFERGDPFSLGMLSASPRLRSGMFLTSGVAAADNSDVIRDRGRIRRTESNATQPDTKKHYQLDLNRIVLGEDTRTTLMIKNIPNKYTVELLLAAIDENHHGMYDFFYLPIDFKNNCNVGYAFINMISPAHIISIYEAVNGKKWERFNSEKVASLAYARIQGKAALVGHFQNSSVMNEDKRCRPILFDHEGPGTA